MSDLRVAFGNDKIGRTFSRSVQRERDRVLASMRGSARQMQIEVLLEGKTDIRRASPAFAKSKRWSEGLKAKTTEGGGTIKTTFFHTIPYFWTHEKGATIRAKNKSGLLWIPLSFASAMFDTHGAIWPSDYPDPLFRVNRKGKAPLLLSAVDKLPKYVGVPKVTIKKRFHITEIIRRVTRSLKDIYRKEFRRNKGT